MKNCSYPLAVIRTHVIRVLIISLIQGWVFYSASKSRGPEKVCGFARRQSWQRHACSAGDGECHELPDLGRRRHFSGSIARIRFEIFLYWKSPSAANPRWRQRSWRQLKWWPRARKDPRWRRRRCGGVPAPVGVGCCEDGLSDPTGSRSRSYEMSTPDPKYILEAMPFCDSRDDWNQIYYLNNTYLITN